MPKSDDDHVTFVVPDKPKNKGYGEFGEESQRPSTPKPPSPPPAQRITSQPTPKDGKEK